jgi:hypothetical protein
MQSTRESVAMRKAQNRADWYQVRYIVWKEGRQHKLRPLAIGEEPPEGSTLIEPVHFPNMVCRVCYRPQADHLNPDGSLRRPFCGEIRKPDPIRE